MSRTSPQRSVTMPVSLALDLVLAVYNGLLNSECPGCARCDRCRAAGVAAFALLPAAAQQQVWDFIGAAQREREEQAGAADAAAGPIGHAPHVMEADGGRR